MECYSPNLPTLPVRAFHATRLNELCRIWPLNSALAALLSQSTKSKSPVKCYMHPANSWTQGCHWELWLMAGSESSPSNYAPPSWGCVFALRRTKTTRRALQQTTKWVWHLCLPEAEVWELCSHVACWPQERRLTLSYRLESIAMAPLGAQTSCKLLPWLTLMCCGCNIESW